MIEPQHRLQEFSQVKSQGGERLQAHRDKQVAKGGDDATEETHDQWTIRSDHELCCCSHGNATCQSGILDMYLSGKTAY